MPATIEELIALVLALQGRVAKAEARAEVAEARCAALEKENAELKARLGKNSSNSSKPPSSDSPYKAKRPVKRGLRKPGGQPGHKGSTCAWLPPERVDEHKLVRAPECLCGARNLSRRMRQRDKKFYELNDSVMPTDGVRAGLPGLPRPVDGCGQPQSGLPPTAHKPLGQPQSGLPPVPWTTPGRVVHSPARTGSISRYSLVFERLIRCSPGRSWAG